MRADPEYPVVDADDPDLDESGNGSLVQSVQRALRIVRLFDSGHPEWSAAELTRRSGLRRTTAFRLIRTLEAGDLITLNPGTGKYSLGPAVYQLAYVWIAQASLARMAAPHLERLADATDESVGLWVWNGDGPLCVAHSPSPRPFKFLMYVGQGFTDMWRTPIARCSSPSGPRRGESRRSASPSPALTAFTITDRDRYADELRRVAAKGWPTTFRSSNGGSCAMAVPVRDYSGEVRASLFAGGVRGQVRSHRGPPLRASAQAGRSSPVLRVGLQRARGRHRAGSSVTLCVRWMGVDMGECLMDVTPRRPHLLVGDTTKALGQPEKAADRDRKWWQVVERYGSLPVVLERHKSELLDYVFDGEPEAGTVFLDVEQEYLALADGAHEALAVPARARRRVVGRDCGQDEPGPYRRFERVPVPGEARTCFSISTA